MKKLFIVMVVIVLFVFGVFVGSYFENIKIGVILGFIGLIELLILYMVVGVELVMFEVNESGVLLGGVIVEFVCVDFICIDVGVVIVVVECLIMVDGVKGIMGVDCFGVIGVILNNVVLVNGVVMIFLFVIFSGLFYNDNEDNGLFFCIVLFDVC